MGYKANARTNETGRQMLGEFGPGMQIEDLKSRRRDPLRITPGRLHRAKLGVLLGGAQALVPFHLLASHLHDKGLPLEYKVRYGRAAGVRYIELDYGKSKSAIHVWREYRGTIYGPSES